jgi:hypothetical protein
VKAKGEGEERLKMPHWKLKIATLDIDNIPHRPTATPPQP